MIHVTGNVILKSGREQSFKRFHPWIFSGAIHLIEGTPGDGDWVEISDHNKNPLGFGHFQKGTIAVRVLSFSSIIPNERIWEHKILAAYLQRKELGVISPHTNAYRLVHGEGDGLPGLIIDIYNGVAVVQAHSLGMEKNKIQISQALQEVLKEELTSIYYKGQTTVSENKNEYLLGMTAVPHVIYEHGNKFLVDWETGQKTGFFVDQRESRKLLGKLCEGKKVLNTFCYTGGFSIYALKGGAIAVDSVDSSEKAIDMTRRNLELNDYDLKENICITADTFDFLKDKKNEYDIIILDPPAFAKHKEAKHQAMKGYQRLNAEALRVIKAGGILFTFSCSQVVDKQLFYDTIVSASIQVGREVSVLYHLSQPADHPVSIYHPEGEYLKGLVLYVK